MVNCKFAFFDLEEQKPGRVQAAMAKRNLGFKIYDRPTGPKVMAAALENGNCLAQ